MAAFWVGGASAEDDLRANLQTRYDTMKAAMNAHDDAMIRALLAPDFTSVDVDGNVATGGQMIAQVDGLPRDRRKPSVTTLLSVTADADGALVKQRYDLKVVKRCADGIAHDLEFIALSTDRWIRPAATWLIRRTETDEVSAFRVGQLVAHKVRS